MAEPADDVGILIHDLRNQLGVAIGHCDHLVMDVKRDGPARRTAMKVREACLRAATLVNAWQSKHVAPFTYTIEAGFVQIVVPPTPNPDAFESTLKRVLAHPDYRRGMGILYDRRDAIRPTPEYLKAIVEITRRYGDRLGRCRWAVLVRKSDAVTYAKVREASALVAPSADPRAFSNVDEALRWLKTS